MHERVKPHDSIEYCAGWLMSWTWTLLLLLQRRLFFSEALRASMSPLLRCARHIEADAVRVRLRSESESPAARRMRGLARAVRLLHRLAVWQVRGVVAWPRRAAGSGQLDA